MNETVYIETSVLGYLTARPTDNLILAANIKITQDWWDEYHSSMVLYTSEIVEDEAGKGDPTIAAERLNLLQFLTFLDLTEEATELAQVFFATEQPTPKSLQRCFAHGTGNSLWLEILVNLELQAYGKCPDVEKTIRN